MKDLNVITNLSQRQWGKLVLLGNLIPNSEDIKKKLKKIKLNNEYKSLCNFCCKKRQLI